MCLWNSLVEFWDGFVGFWGCLLDFWDQHLDVLGWRSSQLELNPPEAKSSLASRKSLSLAAVLHPETRILLFCTENSHGLEQMENFPFVLVDFGGLKFEFFQRCGSNSASSPSTSRATASVSTPTTTSKWGPPAGVSRDPRTRGVRRGEVTSTLKSPSPPVPQV